MKNRIREAWDFIEDEALKRKMRDGAHKQAESCLVAL